MNTIDEKSDYAVGFDIVRPDGTSAKATFDAVDAAAELQKIADDHPENAAYIDALREWAAGKGLTNLRWPTLCRVRDQVYLHVKEALGKGPGRANSGTPG